MTVPVVVMIVIGIGFVIASFFVTEKLSKKEESYKLDLLTVDDNYEFSDRERQIIKRKIEDVIAEHAKDIIYETNESLNNMANEKTMALGDYAVAVCDEIEKNHKEVMFLYSMLSDKQKEIMQTVKDVDSEKNAVKDMIAEVNSSQQKLNELKNSQSFHEEMAFGSTFNDKLTPDGINDDNAVRNGGPESKLFSADNLANDTGELSENKTGISNNTVIGKENDRDDLSDSSVSYDNEEELLDAELNDIFAEIDSTDIDFDDVLEKDFKDDSNANEIILEMYRSGNSIIDIAKQLGLGVGEVKLVIDLYQGE